jgi:serine/threonine protein phosphatase 1
MMNAFESGQREENDMAYRTRNPHIADHRLVDLRHARRIFVFGDVHGSLAVLIAMLLEVGFDAAAGDVAICVGDWMDRGPDGLVEVRAFLAANPGILWTRGNHEDILRNACHEGGRHDSDTACNLLIRNGGSWITDHLGEDDDLPNAEAVAFADMLNAAPIAMTVLTPGGKRVGIVHAAVPADSWDDMVAALEGPDPAREDMSHHCMWDRKAADMAIGTAENGTKLDDWNVPGIDHVFYGHTRTGTKPVRHGNQSWIDTGAYRTGILTMVDVDAWIAA